MLSKHTKPLSPTLPVLLLSFTLCLQFSIILFSGISAQAETRYVKPSIDAAVRRGQGTDYKIIAMVKDGTAVDFIEESGDFAKVLLANGKEGWILKRFLSIEPPLDELVASLRAQKEESLQRELESSQQLDTLSAALTRTEQERDLAQSDREQIQASYEKLQQETADVVQINSNMQKISQENTILTQKLVVLEQANETLRKNYTLKWFLAGGGVLLLGIFIGGLARGSRRKRTSLL